MAKSLPFAPYGARVYKRVEVDVWFENRREPVLALRGNIRLQRGRWRGRLVVTDAHDSTAAMAGLVLVVNALKSLTTAQMEKRLLCWLIDRGVPPVGAQIVGHAYTR